MAAAGAVAGFLFTAAVKFHADARDRAFALLVEFQKDKDLNKAIRNVGIFFRLNQGLDVNTVIQLYKSHDRYAIKLRRDIDLIGNFYEDMAIAVKCKEINEEIIEEYFKGLLIRYCVHMRNNNIFLVLRNNPPIANAGSPQTVPEHDSGIPTFTVVTLDGSASSDPDDPITFSWSKLSQSGGAPITLSDSNISNPTFTSPNITIGDDPVTIVFQLTVSDDRKTNSDTVSITITFVD